MKVLFDLSNIFFFPNHSMKAVLKNACIHLAIPFLALNASLPAEFNPQADDIDSNPYISPKAREAMRPYLLPTTHRLHCIMDSIFLKTRATTDEKSFRKAGFQIIAKGPRSFVCVAKHKKFPRYLVKVYLDDELQKKLNMQSWKWLVKRCKGAKKIRDIIRQNNFRHFVVPAKWIYCLPPHPSPPNDAQHTRHLAILVVERMKLVSESKNLKAWKHKITREHLDELFEILRKAKGSSYRPDNIAYTTEGTFAFIDTEYPFAGPDFGRIRKYLNREMRNYWDRLVISHGYKLN